MPHPARPVGATARRGRLHVSPVRDRLAVPCYRRYDSHRVMPIPEPTRPGWPPIHWRATCSTCGRTLAADRQAMSRYLRDGWPTCCGHAMTFAIVRGQPPGGPEPGKRETPRAD